MCIIRTAEFASRPYCLNNARRRSPCPHPARGDVELVGQPLVLSRTPAQIKEPAPDKGEHTEEILADFGLSAAEIERLRSERVV
jgi:crotonobetainyl-CoA:carnitine CoA-transferase CaiB-like acyl-CoA transferase